jgi:hypothetical protein
MAYVYQHIRLDNSTIFYIGIGSDSTYKRANNKYNRNQVWKRISKKYGYSVEIIYDNITWEDACNKEIELIKKYGRINLGSGDLVNMTDGGEGLIGLIHTEDHRKKNSDSNKGKKKSEEFVEKLRNRTVSDETKLKISVSNRGKKRTVDQRQKMKDSLKGKYIGENNHFFGKNHTDESKNKISKAAKGRKLSVDIKKKIGKSNTGKTHPHTQETKEKLSYSAKLRNIKPPSRKGMKHTEETKQKMREARLKRKEIKS